MNKANKYRKGKIYSIRSDQTEDIYIGSTIKRLEKRLEVHEAHYKAFNNGTFHYVASYELLKHANYKIELLERYPCDSEEELRRREGYFHKTVDCVNMRIAGRTDAEYYEDNKEKIIAYQKQYNLKNKEIISDRNKEYAKANKIAIKEQKARYYQANKELAKQKAKQLYQDNKEKIKEQVKQYRQDNKSKIKSKRKQL